MKIIKPKKLKKSLKKVLTKGRDGDIINKLSRRGREKSGRKRKQSSLKIEQQHHKIDVKSMCIETPKFF